ncbi:MAG: PglZ domain-containing protein [Bacteroidales bacterium]|nr:PglZ domain-containing protein [Bacteroidales bacterium]
MHWQSFIDIRLNYENNLPVLVIDQTGVLYAPAYRHWLSEKDIEVKLTDEIMEIRKLVDYDKQVLIITAIEDIPFFIRNKITPIAFSYNDLPLNGDIKQAFKNISTSQIVEILDYVFATNMHQVLSANDLEKVLEKSEQFASTKQLSILSNQIKKILAQEADTNNILRLAKLWAELIYLSYKTDNNEYKQLTQQVDAFSDTFIDIKGMEQAFYASTHKKPKTVDKILANIKADKQEKIALICFDCMGFAEWYLLKDFFKNQQWEFEDSAVFALLPTLTSISRSAIFQGNTEVYNLKYPGRNTEAKAFSEYFKDKETKYFTEADEINSNTLLGYEYISILYNFFDELSHSAQFPPNKESKELYFKSVLAYLEKSSIIHDFQILIENGFQIYICSDHGSVVAKGNGRKIEKYLSDDFAKRAVIVNKGNEELINERKVEIPFVEDKILILPEGRTMFANKNQIEVNHGGTTVEEMVVPYIKMKKI